MDHHSGNADDVDKQDKPVVVKGSFRGKAKAPFAKK
jgi:hypothetical protein